METKKIIGIVTSIRKDKKGIQVLDSWYLNKFKDDVKCKIGDNVEIEYYTKGQYNNYTSIKTLTIPEKNTEQVKLKKDSILETRKYVDAGNLVKEAVQLVIANKYKTLKEACDDLFINFIKLSYSIECNDLRPEPIQVNDFNNEGEYE